MFKSSSQAWLRERQRERTSFAGDNEGCVGGETSAILTEVIVFGIGRTSSGCRRAVLDGAELRLTAWTTCDERILHADGRHSAATITVGTSEVVGVEHIFGGSMIEQQAADTDVVGNVLILVDQDDAGLAIEIGEVVLLEGSIDGADIATIVHVVGRDR